MQDVLFHLDDIINCSRRNIICDKGLSDSVTPSNIPGALKSILNQLHPNPRNRGIGLGQAQQAIGPKNPARPIDFFACFTTFMSRNLLYQWPDLET